MLQDAIATVLNAIYPPRCLACLDGTSAPHGLCAACWADTHFIAGATCRKCGTPLVGEAEPGALCDGCLRHPPAWDRGAAAILYTGAGRRAVLALKHGDRLDMVPPLGAWMARAGAPLVAGTRPDRPGAAALAAADQAALQPVGRARRGALARRAGKPMVADLLERTRQTAPQEGMDRAARAANQAGAFRGAGAARAAGWRARRCCWSTT